MGLFIHRKEKNYTLAVWKIEESDTQLLSLLPEQSYYESAIQQFKTPRRIQEWLAVRVLLYQVLGKHIIVKYHDTGKPYIDEGQISISHTKGYVAIIVSCNENVGVDIEYYSQRVHKVASKFMREDEIVNPYQSDNTWSLLLYWSAKETLFKSIDDVEIDFRKHLHILPFTIQDQGMFEAHTYKPGSQYIFDIHYLLMPDFVLTWQVSKIDKRSS